MSRASEVAARAEGLNFTRKFHHTTEGHCVGWIRGTQVFSNADNNYMHRSERYARALAKAVRAKQLEDQHNLDEEDAVMLRSCICDDLPTTLHTLMFLPSILSLFDDEQQRHWVPLAKSYKVYTHFQTTPSFLTSHPVFTLSHFSLGGNSLGR